MMSFNTKIKTHIRKTIFLIRYRQLVILYSMGEREQENTQASLLGTEEVVCTPGAL